jgi:hypothetical protein
MKCYDFKLNISAYIEGELKQVVRQSFNEHKENCTLCKEKLADISQLMDKMPKFTPLATSHQFIHNLNAKIQEIDNRGPSIWEHIMQFKPFGFEPVPALGFSVAIVMVIGASYLLMNRDGLPEINMEKLSTQSQQKTPRPFKPSIVIPPQTGPSVADSDSAVKPDSPNRFDHKIKLTGSN